MSKFVCTCCGKEDDPDSFINGETKSMMIEKTVCFSCAYWYTKVSTINDPEIAIIDGRYYAVGHALPGAGVAGFGGRKFIIKFNDGREVTTFDLWNGSSIPPEFLEMFPDNAKFIIPTWLEPALQ